MILTASAANADTIAGRAAVIDADTLEIHGERIRILDIDAPVSRQTCEDEDGAPWRCGQQAALALSDWIAQQPVTCDTTKRDRYKRWLARCSVGGVDLAEWLASPRGLPLVERKKRLQALLAENKDQKMIQLAEHLDVAGQDVLKAACNLKLEGIVSKRLSEPYVSGRTGIWTKAKCRATQHAMVGGWTISPKGFSGHLLGAYKGKKLIPIGRVGTGFPQKLLRWLEPRLKQIETDVSPFSAPIPRKPGRTIHYAKPELVAGFEMTSWTNDGVIRQASLQEVRERTDKDFRPDWINLPAT